MMQNFVNGLKTSESFFVHNYTLYRSSHILVVLHHMCLCIYVHMYFLTFTVSEPELDASTQIKILCIPLSAPALKRVLWSVLTSYWLQRELKPNDSNYSAVPFKYII